MAEIARLRLGSESAWFEVRQVVRERCHVTADWCSELTSDFEAWVTREEMRDFAARMLTRISSASGAAFTESVGAGRGNPLVLHGVPAGDGFAFFPCFTPRGDDTVCVLRMEIGPIRIGDLVEAFEDFHRDLG